MTTTPIGVAQYHEMLCVGILKSGAPIELLEGVLVRKSPKTPAHVFATGYLVGLMTRFVPAGWIVASHSPITTRESEPEPDIAVIRGNRRLFLVEDRHPDPAETGLVIEVADSSLANDRSTKTRIYARAGIPRYWIVNIVDRCVEVYSEPTGPSATPTYQRRQDFVPGDKVPVMVDGQEIGQIAVAELFR